MSTTSGTLPADGNGRDGVDLVLDAVDGLVAR